MVINCSCLTKHYFDIVFIHEKEDLMWVALGSVPTNIPVHGIELGRGTQNFFFEFQIKKKMKHFLDQPNAHCREYSDGPNGHNICSKRYISSYLSANADCILPGKCTSIAVLLSAVTSLRFIDLFLLLFGFISLKQIVVSFTQRQRVAGSVGVLLYIDLVQESFQKTHPQGK